MRDRTLKLNEVPVDAVILIEYTRIEELCRTHWLEMHPDICGCLNEITRRRDALQAEASVGAKPDDTITS